jgi:hypothetical protein
MNPERWAVKGNKASTTTSGACGTSTQHGRRRPFFTRGRASWISSELVGSGNVCPQRRFSARFWLWLACILAPAVAAPFLHLPQPFGHVLLDASFVAGCVLVFFSSRELDEWARWRADYSRAIDRLNAPAAPSGIRKAVPSYRTVTPATPILSCKQLPKR